jgi:hypothetical protein
MNRLPSPPELPVLPQSHMQTSPPNQDALDDLGGPMDLDEDFLPPALSPEQEPERPDIGHNQLDKDMLSEDDEVLPSEGDDMYQNEDENDAQRLADLRTCQLASQLSDSELVNEPELEKSNIKDIQTALHFIHALRTATLEDSGLEDDAIERLRDPPACLVDLSDPDEELSVNMFIANMNSSEASYTRNRAAVLARHPNDKILSLYEVKKLVAEITGVYSIEDHMCINSCMAYVGPYANLESCPFPECGEPRYDQNILAKSDRKAPRRVFHTIPLGPQLQALCRSKEGAQARRYRDQKTKAVFEKWKAVSSGEVLADNMVYDDIFSGQAFMELSEELGLTENDMVIGLTADGAQLYQNKQSDTFIWAWVIYDISPESRYKKKMVIPGGVAPGPNKPKDLVSFLFRSLQHVSALQRENGGRGMKIWDAERVEMILSRIVVVLALADAVGLPDLDGHVGHHGAHGCRIGCPMFGRHKPGSGHYFSVHLKPINFTVIACNHDDIDIRSLARPSKAEYQQALQKVITSRNKDEYESNRKDTGISKPSILLGLVTKMSMPPPDCFTLDLMHLLSINVPELLLLLWRGTMKCDKSDSKETWDWATFHGTEWTQHGQLVAEAQKYFPSSFHRAPRNPAEKLNSGFKATEWHLYVYGLGPGFFRAMLPKRYWVHFCKLVQAVNIVTQRAISMKQIKEAHMLLIQYVEEYKLLYYQRSPYRLQFCRPCIHTLLHIASEALRVGPGAYTTQYAMERLIGDLGQEIRQQSNPFANLSRRAVLRAQTNALMSMCPTLQISSGSQSKQSEAGIDVGHGYIIMGRERVSHHLEDSQAAAMVREERPTQVRRWGRLQLPNKQWVRSLYAEENSQDKRKVRVTRNVQVGDNYMPIQALC